MNFKFHPAALEEYKDAAGYYEKCQQGLGDRFIAVVEQAISHIVQSPEQWSFFDGDIRRHVARIFPYALLYTIETDYILIVAVMHFHREPGYWKKRLPPR